MFCHICPAPKLTTYLQWDSVAKSDIQERKIRVTFLPGEEGATSGASAATPIRHNLANGVCVGFLSHVGSFSLTDTSPPGRGHTRRSSAGLLVSARR